MRVLVEEATVYRGSRRRYFIKRYAYLSCANAMVCERYPYGDYWLTRASLEARERLVSRLATFLQFLDRLEGGGES